MNPSFQGAFSIDHHFSLSAAGAASRSPVITRPGASPLAAMEKVVTRKIIEESGGEVVPLTANFRSIELDCGKGERLLRERFPGRRGRLQSVFALPLQWQVRRVQATLNRWCENGKTVP